MTLQHEVVRSLQAYHPADAAGFCSLKAEQPDVIGRTDVVRVVVMEVLLGVRDVGPDAIAWLLSGEVGNGVYQFASPLLGDRPRNHAR